MNPAMVLFFKNKRLAKRLYYLSLLRCRVKKKVFSFNKFTDSQIRHLFRFEKVDIINLRRLLKIPFVIKCREGTSCGGLEGNTSFIILLVVLITC